MRATDRAEAVVADECFAVVPHDRGIGLALRQRIRASTHTMPQPLNHAQHPTLPHCRSFFIPSRRRSMTSFQPSCEVGQHGRGTQQFPAVP